MLNTRFTSFAPRNRCSSWLVLGGQVLLALLLAAAPGFGALRCQLCESNESSIPVEANVDWPECRVLDAASAIRRSHWFIARYSAATGAADTRRCHQTLAARPELAISGHFLTSELRAPLRC